MNKSINNAAAVSASNTQISTNAIVRLASDIGNIYSMFKAAYNDSDLYAAIQVIEPEINAIAYDAELLSRDAMEISALAAESINISVKAETLFLDTKAVNERLIGIVDQLIKFERLMVRKKAINPLISDNLIAITHMAASNSINAKSLMEVAFRSIETLVAACQKP